mgnify:FL=1
MRDYQRTKNNKYVLPQTVYLQAIYKIRDYDRMVLELERALESSPEPSDGMPKGTGTSNPTERAVIKRSKYLNDVAVIDKCFNTVPNEYKKGVWNNIVFRERFPNDAARSTYGNYKALFVFEVAKELCLI